MRASSDDFEFIDNSSNIENNKLNKIIVSTIINNSQDTFYFKDIKSRIIVSSKAHAMLWGEEDPKDVIGKTDFDYFPEEFAKIAFEKEQEIIETRTPILGMIEKLIKSNGDVKWLSASKYPLYNEENDVIGTWGISRDITSLKETELKLKELNTALEDANEKLRILNSTDIPTGLYNHGHFLQETKKVFELYKRRNTKTKSGIFSLIIFDIDDLKDINDTYGHLTGDYLLKYISDLISKRIRISDKFFRIGGDEFSILLLDTDLSEAKKLAEDIRRIIAETKINFMGNQMRVTISLGVAAFNEAHNIEDMIHLADERLYLSKRDGKNRMY